MKRFYLPVVLIVLFAFLLVVPPPARAIEPVNFKRANYHIKNSNGEFDFSLDEKKIKRDSSLSEQNYKRYMNYLKSGIKEKSYIIVRDSSTASESSRLEFMFIDDDSEFELKSDSQNYYFNLVRVAKFSFGVYKCGDNLTVSLCLSDSSIISKYNFKLSSKDYSIVGIFSKKPIKYPQNYNGDDFIGSKLPVNSSVQRCEFHDVGCWLRGIFENFQDSIQGIFRGIVGLFERLIEFLSHIFIPGDDNILKKVYDDLSVAMTKKLGFLLFPFEFFSKTLGAFSGFISADDMSEWHCTVNSNNKFCKGVCVPDLIAQNQVCLRIGALEESAPLIWNTVMPVARLGFVLSLVYLLKQKFNEVVGT